MHRLFYEARKKGADRASVEKGCTACRNTQADPCQKKHPPKEQCLICNELHRAKR